MEEDDLISQLFSDQMGAIPDISWHGEAAISSSSQSLQSAWSQSSHMHEIPPLNANANTNILLAQAQGDDGFAMPAEDVEVKRSVLGKRSLPEEFGDNDTYSASLMTDKASMLDEIIEYVRFLQLQVKVMSMSRLGGGGAIPSQGSGSQVSTALSQEGLAFEQTVASLLESDMTTAMQLLQNKGLCLLPMALVTAMSSSTKKPVTHSGKTGSIHDTSSSEKHTPGLSESTCSAIAGIGAHTCNSGSSPAGSRERCFH